jgi:hypothetical protein
MILADGGWNIRKKFREFLERIQEITQVLIRIPPIHRLSMHNFLKKSVVSQLAFLFKRKDYQYCMNVPTDVYCDSFESMNYASVADVDN